MELKLKTLRSEKGFDSFISQKNSVVIVHHFLCHGCQVYLEDIKNQLKLFTDIPLARIHLTLNWVIDKAGLYGDVEEENKFLANRFGVGDYFPATLFFKDGKLIKRVNGPQTGQQLRDIIDKTFSG
jgi:hypothetical protein